MHTLGCPRLLQFEHGCPPAVQCWSGRTLIIREGRTLATNLSLRTWITCSTDSVLTASLQDFVRTAARVIRIGHVYQHGHSLQRNGGQEGKGEQIGDRSRFP
jgi:hypothetical protein